MVMKSKANLVSALTLIIATVGIIAYSLRPGDKGTLEDVSGNDREHQGTAQARSTDDHDLTALSRPPRFQSIDDAEQALLDFDLTATKGSDREEAKRCFDRFRNLVARVPEAYYSELAARIGQGADNDLDRLLGQMAIYQEWGRKNLEAACADLSNIENERRFYKALHSVLIGATDVNVGEAMKLAETIVIEPGGFGDFERVDLMDTIYDNWIESDPSSALEWVKQAQVSDKRRSQWISDGLRAWHKRDPDGAEGWREKENFEGLVP